MLLASPIKPRVFVDADALFAGSAAPGEHDAGVQAQQAPLGHRPEEIQAVNLPAHDVRGIRHRGGGDEAGLDHPLRRAPREQRAVVVQVLPFHQPERLKTA